MTHKELTKFDMNIQKGVEKYEAERYSLRVTKNDVKIFFEHNKKFVIKYRSNGFTVENYVVLRSYRGNLFNIEDM